MGYYRALLGITLLAVTALTSAPKAEAYDSDTHFYEAYLLARYAGIGHETSMQLAIFNEYIDVSYLTSPMNPIPLSGLRMRRLFHFPTPLTDRYAYGKKPSIPHKPRRGIFSKFDSLDHTQENSPMAHELIYTGMRKGNLMMVGAGMHVLMDSFGHSPFTPSFGHMSQGHAPDRPYQYYEKHVEMVKAVMQVLARIRQALPEAALDRSFKVGEGKPHAELSAEELAAKYNADERIQAVIRRDTLRDSRFVSLVVEFMIKEAKSHGIYAETFDPWKIMNGSKIFEKDPTVIEIVDEFTDRSMRLQPDERRLQINMANVMTNVMGDFYLNEQQFDRLPEVKKAQFIKELSRRVTVHVVPLPIDKAQPILYEYDGLVRQAEMLIRTADRQELIADLTGRRVAFSKESFDKTLDQVAASMRDRDPLDGVAEMEERLERAAQLTLVGADIAAPNSAQKWQWRWAMVKYQYLDLVAGLSSRWLRKGLGFLPESIQEKFVFGNGRFEATRGTFLYDRERAFRLMLKKGITQNLLSEEDLVKLKAEHEARNAKLKEAGLKTEEAERVLTKIVEDSKGSTVAEFLKNTAAKVLRCRAALEK